ncbi:MAG: DUF5074 domain-containing protein [Clostridium sp.]|nr:DUF5074 domain-containing protein [Prevotella sp.]MCM1428960.1 DUF5074 domain-containing protein [Clostridium sp.]MCM1475994.1 DUF5074 domain-containing protein [Muribaculaceae bacterium]
MNTKFRTCFYSFIVSLISALAISASAADKDYTEGIIFVNEDWYGHQNSTLNYLLPDDPEGVYWQYRVFQAENPGHELGCTNQYGARWNGKLYLIAKQERDPGADITGGRITVADAKTLKMLYQSETIDPSGAQCDGRGFLGVDDHKGYISSSNGIWIFDLDTYEIKGQVKGSANPNAGDDRPTTDPTGSLYHGQTGMMVSASGMVFAAHQQYGLLIIDPEKDEVVKTIGMEIVAEKAGIGSVVKSKDGNLWLSVAKNVQGTGTTLPYIVKLNPDTYEYEIIEIPNGMYPPSNSWYAWTPDAFIASQQENTLYWKGGSNRWFTGSQIYKYDIDKKELKLHIDLDAEGANWKLYGCSMGIDPVSDEIYMSLYHEYGTPSYITRRYAPDGSIVRDYEMISNYWFPSLPIFPEKGESGVEAIKEIQPTIIQVYTLSGLQVYSGEEEDFSAISPRFAKGIYIIRKGSEAYKINLL